MDYILSSTLPIYEILRRSDTDEPCLYMVYEWWDEMIEAIYTHKGQEDGESFEFYDVVYEILLARWTKSSSPLHCMAHSLNPRYYSMEYLQGAPNRVPPHQDVEIARERNTCLKKFYPNEDERKIVNEACLGNFSSSDSINERGKLSPMKWIIYGFFAPKLQKLAMLFLLML